MKKFKYLKAGLIAVFLVLTGIIYSCQRIGKEQSDSTLGTPLAAEETKQADALIDLPKDSDSKNEDITVTRVVETYYVHICGAVKKPGVYEVSPGARIFEVVEMAGGFTKEAAEDYVNQAASIEDGQQVYIPAEDEVLNGEFGDKETLAGSGQAQTGTDNNGKININTATKDELCTLPGIGDAKADSIINYRTDHGKFQSIEELKEINGIKDAVYNKIKDRIVIK